MKRMKKHELARVAKCLSPLGMLKFRPRILPNVFSMRVKCSAPEDDFGGYNEENFTSMTPWGFRTAAAFMDIGIVPVP